MTSDATVSPDWYRTFFTDPVVRFWEAAIPPAVTEAETAFIRRQIAVGPPSRILDVPCGSGRHALALSRAGFRVTGIDLSRAAVRRADAAARAGALSVRFACMDMFELKADEPYDALICMGNSIGYCEPALTRQLLGRFAAALRRGGRLIIDTSICAESLLPLAVHRSFSFPGGSYEQEITYDAMQSLVRTSAQLRLDGERHALRYQHFVMTSGELVRSLRHAHLEVIALYGDCAEAAFAPGSRRLLLVAEKRAPD